MDVRVADGWRRLKRWWRETGLLSNACAVGIVAMLPLMALAPPKTPGDMLGMLAGIALLAALPYMPQVVGPAGLPLCLAATWMSGTSPMDVGVVIVSFCLFIAIGYALSGWVSAAVVVVYALVETVCSVYFGAHSAAVSGVRGFVQGWIDAGREMGTVPPPNAADQPGPLALMVSGTLISMMVSGFAVILGYSFSSNATANARLAREEAMLGRITREQEIAHMIHDSVANDMSTIAMLTWRAKGVEDDTQILDAIYERSHHALNRVHEVIDILNGKRELDPPRPAAEAPALDVAIENLMDEQDRLLHMLGFVGSSHIEGDLHADVETDDSLRETVMALLEESYANIVRHCPPVEGGDGYGVAVDLDGDVIRITATNPISRKPAVLRGIRHGRGLSLHRTAVESLGGMLATGVQDGVWILNARIPTR
ncbi:hypothetical protein BLEM_1136 [Bifidobacterium lemurum]|uniref:Signal transduction histidine kinase subgroup 3 dimerisation and phosphoacceptor domain-containing protein n=1 Tax=Bifidobacterium lemurum TaxID=1603886 RepID=A0A261FSH3_9BIFI|nr:hypothetical protein [Bifidobacterium lemurum]OZG62018.1 hypothetical protein BLEM_1136 [Bifidobacterium lemurum]QOL34851.1 hypothetical protein BL8807_02835 [Bifidobacterium lemurum]